jgi:hypothetical protein
LRTWTSARSVRPGRIVDDSVAMASGPRTRAAPVDGVPARRSILVMKASRAITAAASRASSVPLAISRPWRSMSTP